MTGGSLPAMTWQRDHELRAPGHRAEGHPGRATGTGTGSDAQGKVASNKEAAPPLAHSHASDVLTRRGADALIRIER